MEDRYVTLLSHSRLSTYASCPEKFRLLYLEEVPPEPQGAFHGGIAIHKTIQHVEENADPLDPTEFIDGAAIPSYFEATLRNMVEDSGGEDKIRWSRGTEDLTWWLRFGPGMLRNYHLQRVSDETRGWTVLPQFTEVELTLPVGDEALLRGRTDQVLATPDDDIIIRDFKTGAKRSDSILQLALYAKLLEPMFPIIPSWGELVYLRKIPQVERFELAPYLAPATAWLEGVLAGIRSGSFFLSPGPFCASCSVRSFCVYGSTLGREKADA